MKILQQFISVRVKNIATIYICLCEILLQFVSVRVKILLQFIFVRVKYCYNIYLLE